MSEAPKVYCKKKEDEYSKSKTIIICKGWYWVADKEGVLHKQCVHERNCSKEIREKKCGLYNSSEVCTN